MTINKILITGGCGFIGSHIVEYFFKKYLKAKIVVFDKITYAASIKNLDSIRKNKRVEIIKSDILNYRKLKTASKGPINSGGYGRNIQRRTRPQ